MSDEVRRRILQAGREALVQEGYELLRRGLKMEHVIGRAGVSHTTFYREFPNEVALGGLSAGDNYLEALLSSLVTDSPRSTHIKLVEEMSRRIKAGKGDPRQAIRAVSHGDLAEVRSDPATLIRLFVVAMARRHDGAMRAVRDEYRQMTEYGEQAYADILKHWGVSLRRPFTLRSIAVLFTATVEGLVLRWLANPDDVSDELFGDAIVALVAAVVDVEQRHEHIDDVIAPLAAEVMREFPSAQQDLPDYPRQAVIGAAAVQFGQRGYFSTQLTHIAATAGVDLPVLKRLFPSKAAIVVAALRPAYEDLREGVATDTGLELPVAVILRRHLERFARMVIENRAMSDALFAMTMHDTTRRVGAELDFPGILVPVIEAGPSSGTPAAEVAALLTNALLVQAFTRRDQSAAEAAATVADVFLAGWANAGAG